MAQRASPIRSRYVCVTFPDVSLVPAITSCVWPYSSVSIPRFWWRLCIRLQLQILSVRGSEFGCDQRNIIQQCTSSFLYDAVRPSGGVASLYTNVNIQYLGNRHEQVQYITIASGTSSLLEDFNNHFSIETWGFLPFFAKNLIYIPEAWK